MQMQTDMECKGKTYLWSQIFFISTTTILLIATNILHVHCHVHEPHLCTFLQPRQHKLRQAIATQHRITISNFNHLQFHSQLKFHSPNFKPFLSPPPPTPPNPSTTSQLLFTKTSTHIHRLVHSYITLFMLHRKCNSHLILL